MKTTKFEIAIDGTVACGEKASTALGRAFYAARHADLAQYGMRWTRLPRALADESVTVLMSDLSTNAHANAVLLTSLFQMAQMPLDSHGYASTTLKSDALGWTLSSDLGYMRFMARLFDGRSPARVRARHGFDITVASRAADEDARTRRVTGRETDVAEAMGILWRGGPKPAAPRLDIHELGMHGAFMALDDFNDRHGWTGVRAFVAGYFLAASVSMWQQALTVDVDSATLSMNDINSNGVAWDCANAIALDVHVERASAQPG